MDGTLSKQHAQRLFEEHAAYVFRTALLLTKSKVLADDITQETFLHVFRKYDSYDPLKPIRPWLYRIVVNTTRNQLRKQKWLSFIGHALEQVADNSTGDEILQLELERALKREVDKLSWKSKEVVVLHFYTGLKLNEIADVLEIPLGTCKSRLHTALTTLRRRLPENDLFDFDKGDENVETR